MAPAKQNGVVSSDDSLMQLIGETSAFFNRLTSLVPQKYYNTDQYAAEAASGKYMKHKNFAKTKEGKVAILKNRKRKLDPEEPNDAAAADNTALEEPIVNPVAPVKKAKLNASITELRARLKARLDELRGNRPEVKAEDGKPKRLDKTEQKKLKKKLARQRAKERKQLAREKANGPTELSTSNLGTPNAKTGGVTVDTPEGPEIVYSKFDLAASGSVGRKRTWKKPLKEQLKKVVKKEQKLTELKDTNPEAFVEKKQDAAWDRSLKHAEGEKVLDNPTLLKKTLKREEKLKQRSSKKWQERKDAQDKGVKFRQDKREANIQARVQARKDPKGAKKNAKKARAGFEGKKKLGGGKKKSKK
eukprot:Clim_evm43s232 gene=Clim_evmTU43s232